jgi:hypothetical protein
LTIEGRAVCGGYVRRWPRPLIHDPPVRLGACHPRDRHGSRRELFRARCRAFEKGRCARRKWKLQHVPANVIGQPSSHGYCSCVLVYGLSDAIQQLFLAVGKRRADGKERRASGCLAFGPQHSALSSGQELDLDVAFKRQAVKLSRCTIAIRYATKLKHLQGRTAGTVGVVCCWNCR